MNTAQRLWWLQAKSDHAVFRRLRAVPGVEPCHLLHYLQMASEKVAKAYFWRTNKPPPKAHTGFVGFLRALLVRSPREQAWIANVFRFPRADDLTAWLAGVRGLAVRLQNLAPSESADGPNPEYPWPHLAPTHYPAGYEFGLWRELSEAGKGRKLTEFIATAVDRFEEFA